MRQKILFSDFDGTLFINGVVSASDRDAIRRWRANGNLFAMASGRNLPPLKEYLAREGVEWDYLLCLNGAEAYDSSEKCLFEVPIDISLLPGLYRTIVQDDGWANICHGLRGERICTEHCSYINSDHIHYSEDHLSTFSKFTQICSAAKNKDSAGAFEIKKRVLEKYGDYVSAEVNGWSIDINAHGVNKASGIARLIECIGISADCVLTIGDNYNDLSMLTAFEGYVVRHSPEEVRKQVGRTVSNVAELIERLSV